MTQRYAVTVTRWAQETASNENGPYLTGRDVVESTTVTECADRAALDRELEAAGVSYRDGRREESGSVRSTRYLFTWAPIDDECPLPEVDADGVQVSLHLAPAAAPTRVVIDRKIPALLSMTEVAARLGVTRQAVHLMITTGRLPAAQVGKAWVIRSATVDAMRPALHGEQPVPDGAEVVR